MKNFKQKDFSKTKSALKFIKDHPVLPISAASLGVGVANYATNTKRTRDNEKYQKAQLEAISNMNNSLIENNRSLREVSAALGENSGYLRQQSNRLIKEPEKPKRKRFRLFSIQDGGYRGRKITPEKSNVGIGAGIGAVIGSGFGLLGAQSNPAASGSTSVAVGALLGAGIGALFTWMSNIARESIFNSGLSRFANSYALIKALENYFTPKTENSEEEVVTETETVGNKTISRSKKTVTSPRISTVNPVGTLFSVDSDPKKYICNVLLRGNVLVILVNNPNSNELRIMNAVLDKYCSKYKNADYTSRKLDKNSYLVEVKVVQGAEAEVVLGFINNGIKVNILTGDRFGIKNR